MGISVVLGKKLEWMIIFNGFFNIEYNLILYDIFLKYSILFKDL